MLCGKKITKVSTMLIFGKKGRVLSLMCDVYVSLLGQDLSVEALLKGCLNIFFECLLFLKGKMN